MNLFFIFDEYTDDLDENGVQALADISLDALLNPDKPRATDESPIGEVTRQFWNRAIQYSTPTCRARFESTWSAFTASVVEQARDRESGRIRSVEEHMAVRRFTIGAEPCYALAELGLSIPSEVYNHPALRELRAAVTDIIIYDNDLTSYNKEQASGDDLHNIITITMHENTLDLDDALEWVANRHRKAVEDVLAAWRRALALSFSPQVDEDVSVYIDHILNWPRANDCWNFENGRYFGEDGLRIQKDRIVELAPPKTSTK